MRILVPLTGEFVTFEEGNSDDPVRPIEFARLLPSGLDDFAWELVGVDFEKGLAELEFQFEKKVIVDEFDVTPDGRRIAKRWHQEVDEEFNTRRIASENALRSLLSDNTTDELYQKVGQSRLRKPFRG